MKRNLNQLILTSACAGMALIAASASGEPRGFYLRGDVGATWTPDTELKEYFGSVAPGSKVKFDPGSRLGVAAGYQLTDWFSAEAQTGVMISNIKSISGADRVDAFFSNVPLLLNGRLQWPSRCPFTPYIGGGAGMSVSSLEIDKIELNGTAVEGSQSDAVFAYQGFAGIRYRLNNSMSLGLEYHYFAAAEPSWDAENISGNIRFGRTETHAVTFAFEYAF